MTLADGGNVIDGSKYSTSTNPLTGLYYRLHILNVGESDVKKYYCDALVNKRTQTFFLQLILIGRCYCKHTFIPVCRISDEQIYTSVVFP
jgi:hypothetical protein